MVLSKDDLVNVSKMSGKMRNFRAISTSPLSNPFCMEKCGFGKVCYSKIMLETARKNTRPAFERNSKILSTKLIERENINKTFYAGEHIRFSAHGELINDTHFINLCRIAGFYPHATFTLWTKRLDIVNRNMEHVPENMRMIYSNNCVNPNQLAAQRIPEGFVGVFNVYTKEFAKENNININCQRSCAECMRCYTEIGFITNELMKAPQGNDSVRYEKFEESE